MDDLKSSIRAGEIRAADTIEAMVERMCAGQGIPQPAWPSPWLVVDNWRPGQGIFAPFDWKYAPVEHFWRETNVIEAQYTVVPDVIQGQAALPGGRPAGPPDDRRAEEGAQGPE